MCSQGSFSTASITPALIVSLKSVLNASLVSYSAIGQEVSKVTFNLIHMADAAKRYSGAKLTAYKNYRANIELYTDGRYASALSKCDKEIWGSVAGAAGAGGAAGGSSSSGGGGSSSGGGGSGGK